MRDPRTHLYRLIHKAVRLLLSELSAQVGSTDYGSERELSLLRTKVTHAFTMLSAHADHEDHYVRPLLLTYSPAVAHHLESAHHEQHATMDHLQQLMARIDPRAPELQERSDAFRAALTRYVAHQFEHMADEEELAQSALYRHMDDAALIEVHDALVQSVPPDEMMGWLSYMLPACSGPERAGMLAGMRAGAPPEAFAAVVELARQVLSTSAFGDLRTALALDAAA